VEADRLRARAPSLPVRDRLRKLPRPFFPVLLFAHRTSHIAHPSFYSSFPPPVCAPFPIIARLVRLLLQAQSKNLPFFLYFFNEACILIVSLFVPSSPPSDIVPLLHSLFFFCALSQAAGSDDAGRPLARSKSTSIALHLRLSSKFLRPSRRSPSKY
jgi:hypothetical protein